MKTINEDKKRNLTTAVGLSFWDKDDIKRLNIKERNDMQQRIHTLMTFFYLQDDKATVEFLYNIAKMVGAGEGKYAQYEFAYDLAFHQNTHESIVKMFEVL